MLFVAPAVGVFGLLPRLGGVTRDAAGLRHARPGFVAAAIVVQAVSLGCYALLYRRVLASLGARLRFRLAEVTLSTFLVSHVTPFGSATGTLLNVSTLEAEGIAASTTGEAPGLTSLVSTAALVALFGTGLAATAGQHISPGYLMIAGIALALVVSATAIALVLVVLVLAIAFLVSAHPGIAERAARRAAGWARHVRPSIDPEKAAQTSKRLVMPARSALTGRAFLESYGFASADLLFDLLPLDLMFLAFRYQPGFGPLAAAYCGGEHRQRHPPHTRWDGHRGDPGGHHRRLRRAAGHGGHRRARLPGRELLAPAAAGAVAYLRLRLSLNAANNVQAPRPPAG